MKDECSREWWQMELRKIYRDFCLSNKKIDNVFASVIAEAKPGTSEETLRMRCQRKLMSLV